MLRQSVFDKHHLDKEFKLCWEAKQLDRKAILEKIGVKELFTLQNINSVIDKQYKKCLRLKPMGL